MTEVRHNSSPSLPPKCMHNYVLMSIHSISINTKVNTPLCACTQV